MIPLLIGGGLLLTAAALSDDDDDEQLDDTTRRKLSENELPSSVKHKLNAKRQAQKNSSPVKFSFNSNRHW